MASPHPADGSQEHPASPPNGVSTSNQSKNTFKRLPPEAFARDKELVAEVRTACQKHNYVLTLDKYAAFRKRNFKQVARIRHLILESGLPSDMEAYLRHRIHHYDNEDIERGSVHVRGSKLYYGHCLHSITVKPNIQSPRNSEWMLSTSLQDLVKASSTLRRIHVVAWPIKPLGTYIDWRHPPHNFREILRFAGIQFDDKVARDYDLKYMVEEFTGCAALQLMVRNMNEQMRTRGRLERVAPYGTQELWFWERLDGKPLRYRRERL